MLDFFRFIWGLTPLSLSILLNLVLFFLLIITLIDKCVNRKYKNGDDVMKKNNSEKLLITSYIGIGFYILTDPKNKWKIIRETSLIKYKYEYNIAVVNF
jgi:hypothetical protein